MCLAVLLHALAVGGRHVSLGSRIRQWKPPEEFKDWNDVVMRRPYVQKTENNKFQRDAALAERRKGIKIQ